MNPAAALLLDEHADGLRFPRRAPAPFPHRPAVVAAARAVYAATYPDAKRTRARFERRWRLINADDEPLAYHPIARAALAAGLRALADAFPDPTVAHDLADLVAEDWPFRLEDA